MKLSTSLNRNKSHKLNQLIGMSFESHQAPRLNQHHITFHHSQLRLETDVTELPVQGQVNSFYDGFQFVDPLTNNKVVYRDVRKASNSLMQLRNKEPNKADEIPQMNSLLQIYKKTKNFQMKSLKQKIFKKINSGKQLGQKTHLSHQCPLQDDQQKPKKCASLIQKPLTACQFIQSSRKKNKLKSLLDRTITDINKAQLQRMVSSKSIVRPQVLQFNKNLLDMKCTMDKTKIQELMYCREKQEWEVGRGTGFRERHQEILFKDMTNLLEGQDIWQFKDGNNFLKRQDIKQFKNGNNLVIGQDIRRDPDVKAQIRNQQQTAKVFNRNKRKKVSLTSQKDNFFQKMLIHVRNRLKKEGEFLIQPKKFCFGKNMLTKKSRNRQIETANDTNQTDLSQLCFQRKQQSQLVSQVKSLVRENIQHIRIKQSPNNNNIGQSKGQKSITHMIRHNYISNLGMQLTLNPATCYTRDQKGNNLLHMAIRYERPDVIEMIFKKVPYKICRNLLIHQNNHKRTPLQLAKLEVDFKAIDIIERFVLQNRQREIVEGWIGQEDDVKAYG